MQLAIKEAIKTRQKGDYAIGAVIVKDGKILAKAGNRIKLDIDPTQHAEIVAIRKASKLLGTRHLEGCILYTTHEPCPMCASAIIWAKMKGVVFGSNIADMYDYKVKNGNGSWSWRTIDISAKKIIEKGDPKPFVIANFMRKECKNLFHS
jgi:tRNA(Arg) A34 adenosine deaminase TadA